METKHKQNVEISYFDILISKFDSIGLFFHANYCLKIKVDLVSSKNDHDIARKRRFDTHHDGWTDLIMLTKHGTNRISNEFIIT